MLEFTHYVIHDCAGKPRQAVALLYANSIGIVSIVARGVAMCSTEDKFDHRFGFKLAEDRAIRAATKYKFKSNAYHTGTFLTKAGTHALNTMSGKPYFMRSGYAGVFLSNEHEREIMRTVQKRCHNKSRPTEYHGLDASRSCNHVLWWADADGKPL